MTVHTQTARCDTSRAMTEDETRSIAPSIFAIVAKTAGPAYQATIVGLGIFLMPHNFDGDCRCKRLVSEAPIQAWPENAPGPTTRTVLA